MPPRNCVILVGHGGVPTDCPAGLVGEFKRLDAASKGKPSARLAEVEAKLRHWPRTEKTDPYKAGLEAVARGLRQRMPDRLVLEAYNEFCAPSLEEAVADAISRGAREITVISTMFTRGGVHSEADIPKILGRLGQANPGVALRYAWPFDIEAVSSFLAGQVALTEAGGAR